MMRLDIYGDVIASMFPVASGFSEVFQGLAVHGQRAE